MYLMDAGAESCFFAGDTALTPDTHQVVSEILHKDSRQLDVALLPIGSWGPQRAPWHLGPFGAARLAGAIGSRVVVPIHWGTLHPRGRAPGSWFHDPPRRFADQVAELAPDVEVRVLSQGDAGPAVRVR